MIIKRTGILSLTIIMLKTKQNFNKKSWSLKKLQLVAENRKIKSFSDHGHRAHKFFTSFVSFMQQQEEIPQFQLIANQFVQWYYEIHNSENRPALRGVYDQNSFLTYQDKQLVGVDSIMEKILDQQLSQMIKIPQPSIQPIAQPSFESSGAQLLLITVFGELKVTPEEDNTIPFVEIFLLQPTENSFVIKNQIFTTHSF